MWIDRAARGLPFPPLPSPLLPSLEKSNLLIVRGGSRHQLPTSPSVPRRAVNQMMFRKIQAKDLVQVKERGEGWGHPCPRFQLPASRKGHPRAFPMPDPQAPHHHNCPYPLSVAPKSTGPTFGTHQWPVSEKQTSPPHSLANIQGRLLYNREVPGFMANEGLQLPFCKV